MTPPASASSPASPTNTAPTSSSNYQINPALLGGLRIRVGNDVFDGSVQGRLDRLANAF